MSEREARFESMIFNYETTGQTDFRDGEILPISKTIYKPKSTCLWPRLPPLKDLNALTDWKPGANVPFSLMHKPKEIVQTDPRESQKVYLQNVDDMQKEVQKTRPRVVITPAVALDDGNERDRDLVVKNMYMTSLMKMDRDSGITTGNNVRAPLSPVYAPADPIRLERLKELFVSPEWRMDSVTWDLRQLRAHCDPNKYFWLDRTPNCQVCKETSERDAKQKMMRAHRSK